MATRLKTLGHERPHFVYSLRFGTWLVMQRGRLWGEGYDWRAAWDNFIRLNRVPIHHIPDLPSLKKKDKREPE